MTATLAAWEPIVTDDQQVPIGTMLLTVTKWLFAILAAPVITTFGILWKNHKTLRAAIKADLDEQEGRIMEQFDGVRDQVVALDKKVEVLQTAHTLTTYAISQRLDQHDRLLEKR